MIFSKKSGETKAKKEKAEKKAKAPAPKKQVEKKAESQASSSARVSDFGLLLQPVFTEKSSLVGGSAGINGGTTVVFRVRKGSSKLDIKNAVERAFKVEVAAVRTCNFIGKVKRTMRSTGRRAGFKKAYITLKQGHSISVVEGL